MFRDCFAFHALVIHVLYTNTAVKRMREDTKMAGKRSTKTLQTNSPWKRKVLSIRSGPKILFTFLLRPCKNTLFPVFSRLFLFSRRLLTATFLYTRVRTDILVTVKKKLRLLKFLNLPSCLSSWILFFSLT